MSDSKEVFMSFIYCTDESLKNELLSKDYKLIKQEPMQNKTVWVFAYTPKIQYESIDKTKYFISDLIRF
jgi:hypothetical protein